MITTIIIIVTYIASAWFNYKWDKKAYSLSGRWSHLKPNCVDWFMCFMPFLNVIVALDNLLDSPYDRT